MVGPGLFGSGLVEPGLVEPGLVGPGLVRRVSAACAACTSGRLFSWGLDTMW